MKLKKLVIGALTATFLFTGCAAKKLNAQNLDWYSSTKVESKTIQTENNLTYYHINCPAILSVNKVKDIPLKKKIETIAFSIQLPHNIGISNHCCSGDIYKLSIDVLVDIVQKGFKVEIIAHHKSRY